MSARFIGWSAAAAATLLAVALVVGELVDAAQRRWWSAHALTTDTVSGLLVLLVTVLVVNQLLNLRQSQQRGHAVASQAAVMVAQAARAAKAVSAVTAGTGDRDAASDGFRTYMMMLLTSAPLLINDRVARHFLEQAQYLGAIMGRMLAALDRPPQSSADGAAGPGGGLDDAMAQLKSAADPLLQLLNPAVRDSIQGIGQTSEE